MDELAKRIVYKWQAGGKKPLLVGKPGVGKTAFVNYLAKKLNTGIRVINLSTFEGVDANGMPYINPDTHELTISKPWWLEGMKDGDILFLDEFSNACLTKGHMVAMADGTRKDVADIRIGDMVLSVGNDGIEAKPVEETYTKVVNELYVCYNDGKALTISSGDHLHYTDDGYKRVQDIKAGDFIYVKESELGNAETLQLLRENTNRINGQSKSKHTQVGEGVLRKDVWVESDGRTKSRASRSQTSENLQVQSVREDLQMGTLPRNMQQPRMQSCNSKTNVGEIPKGAEARAREGGETQANNAEKIRNVGSYMGERPQQSLLKRRERALQQATTKTVGKTGARMGNGIADNYTHNSTRIQGGHSEPTLYGGDRDRWSLAQQSDSTRKGLEKTEGVRRVRVDSVAVLERADFERLGYSGRVYCFNVKDNHNFIANGVITHNCTDVRNAFLQIILDQKLPSGAQMPHLRIIGAMNPASDLEGYVEFSNAMKDRWAFIPFDFPVDEWHKLYKDNFGKPQTPREKQVREKLSEFLTTNPHLLEGRKPLKASAYGITDESEATTIEYATPNRRNWDNLARELAQTKDEEEERHMRKAMFMENVGLECWRTYKEYIATENKPLDKYKWDGEPDEITQQINRLKAEPDVDKQAEYFVRAYKYCENKEVVASVLPDVLKNAISKYSIDYRTKIPEFYEIYQKIGA